MNKTVKPPELNLRERTLRAREIKARNAGYHPEVVLMASKYINLPEWLWEPASSFFDAYNDSPQSERDVRMCDAVVGIINAVRRNTNS